MRIIVLCLPAIFMLTACKEVLYSDLAEGAANEMVAILAASDIDASRNRDKDGIYSISVDNDQIAAATIALRQAGLPREAFQSLGEVFGASGLVGTPLEQHARYTHALNQELSQTLSGLDNVQLARVTINMPIPGRYARETPVATASVALHYEDGFDTSENLPKIRQIVSHSVPNLPYEKVAVSFFEAAILKVSKPVAEDAMAAVNTASVLPAGPSYQKRSLESVYVGIGLAIFGIIILFFVFMSGSKPGRPMGSRFDEIRAASGEGKP